MKHSIYFVFASCWQKWCCQGRFGVEISFRSAQVYNHVSDSDSDLKCSVHAAARRGSVLVTRHRSRGFPKELNDPVLEKGKIIEPFPIYLTVINTKENPISINNP